MGEKLLRLGPVRTNAWWEENNPTGSCPHCGGDCDGDDCGLHAAGCIYGGPANAEYWMIAAGCQRFHGELEQAILSSSSDSRNDLCSLCRVPITTGDCMHSISENGQVIMSQKAYDKLINDLWSARRDNSSQDGET